jgi:hypothetical protein
MQLLLKNSTLQKLTVIYLKTTKKDIIHSHFRFDIIIDINRRFFNQNSLWGAFGTYKKLQIGY